MYFMYACVNRMCVCVCVFVMLQYVKKYFMGFFFVLFCSFFFVLCCCFVVFGCEILNGRVCVGWTVVFTF